MVRDGSRSYHSPDSPEGARVRALLQKLAAGSTVGAGECERDVVPDGDSLYAVRDDGGALPDGGVLIHLKRDVDSPDNLASVRVSKWVDKKLGTLPKQFVCRAGFDAFLENATAEALRERISSAQSRRERSEVQMKRRLAEEGFEKAPIESAVRRAVACGLIDDCRFAESFIVSKIKLGWGRSRIERELERAGVDVCSIPDYPDRFFSVIGEEERAMRLLLKKPIPTKNPVEKLARFLVTRGFEPSLALRLAKEHVHELESTTNECDDSYV